MFKAITNNLRAFLATAFLLFAGTAAASEIDTIDIRVTLDPDGTARIKERWVVNVDYSNTEWYLSMKNFGNMVISDFRVFDNDTQRYLDDDTPWDVDRTREQKAGKSGVNSLGGNDCELCWGVGSSGPHNWTAEYNVQGFVKKFQDGCGFNHCFVNYGMSSGPKYVRTTICMADSTPLSVNNARIWAFRYHGTCIFEDDKIVAESSQPLTTENSMIVMCIFPLDAFNSSNTVADTIGTMKWKALEGSDYLERYSDEDYAKGNNVLWKDNEDRDIPWWEVLLVTLVILVGGGLIYGLGYILMAFGLIFGVTLLWHVLSLRPLRIFLRQRKLMKGAPSRYFKDIPLKGNLNRSWYIIDENNYSLWPENKDNLYAAYLIRLMHYKALRMTSQVNEKGKVVNLLSIAKNFPNISASDTADYKCMRKLYEVLRKASGKNLILEKGELTSYLKKNYNDGLEINDRSNREDDSKTKPEEYQEVVGLRNMLNDFTLMTERGVYDVALWDEYLVFATMFGISKKVVKKFKEVCPEYFNQSYIGSQLIDTNGDIIDDVVSYTGISRVSSKLSSSSSSSSPSSSSGGGGYSSSSGGGGGSSGGGGGGGGR